MIHFTIFLIFVCSILILTLDKIKINSRSAFTDQFMQLYFAIHTSQNLQGLSNFKFPPYKFYHELMEVILKWGKETGINLKPCLKEIKVSLNLDRKFEKRMAQFFNQGIFQIFSLFILSWGYYFLLVYQIQKSLEVLELVLIFLWQFSGFSLYLYLLTSYKNRFVRCFYPTLSKLYQFSSLYNGGVPLSNAISESKITQIDHETKIRLENLISEVRSKGVSIKSELTELIDETWYLLELRYEEFVQLMQVLKMVILLLFFVSTYFLLIYKMLTKNLMEF